MSSGILLRLRVFIYSITDFNSSNSLILILIFKFVIIFHLVIILCCRR
nr:MAG TPA: hypothetical protein [Bacteriophage sp.]